MKKRNILVIAFLLICINVFAGRYVVIVRKSTGGRNKKLVVVAGNGFTAGSKAMRIANRRWGVHHIVVRIYGAHMRYRGRRRRARRARVRRRGAPCWHVRLYNRRTRQKRTFWVAAYSKRRAIYNAKAKARRVMRGWRRHSYRLMRTLWIKKVRCPRTRREWRSFKR